MSSYGPGQNTLLVVDNVTGAIITIDYEHHEVHAGNHYGAGFHVESLASGNSADVLIVTPNTTKWAHMVFFADVTAEAVVYVYEGATVSAAGTAITPKNRNRNSTNTSGLTITHTPTVTGTGSAIASRHIGSGNQVGGDSRGEYEFILKQNTTYLFRCTSEAAANEIQMRCSWYEHTSKG